MYYYFAEYYEPFQSSSEFKEPALIKAKFVKEDFQSSSEFKDQ